MIRLLLRTATAASFETDARTPFYAPVPFVLYLDGQMLRREERNVFTLFGLQPESEHTLRAVYEDGTEEELSFVTLSETMAVSVKDFGAVGDGVHDDTRAIQTAVYCLPEGARLTFPAGTYLSFPIALRSHMTLEFQEGAVLLGSTDRERYPWIPGIVPDQVTGEERAFGSFEGNEVSMYQSLLFAEYAEDITIVGPGAVDGNAQNSDFWKDFNRFPYKRPRLMFFGHCRNVRVQGVQARNSASWQLHPYFSENLDFIDVTIEAPKNSPNTDALDPESCDNVRIVGCSFSVGDDCIAIKSGKIEVGKKYKQPAANHMIRNCLMKFGHGAVTLGSEIGAGVRDLTVTQCLFKDTDRGLRIKTRRGRGRDCDIENVCFDRIRMEGVKTPFVINMWYNCVDPDRFSEYVWSREKLPVDDRTPHFGRFVFRDVVCQDAEYAASYIDGLPEAPIEEVVFDHVSVTFRKDAEPGIPIMENFARKCLRLGLYLENVRRVVLEDVQVEGAIGTPVVAKSCGAVEKR
ncbi:MAG: glycoside hydrolase family 28 protein [Clostridia bacterium]|nr:glycoside hydrolase family 28 protein [Clostridia bacterium]